MGAAPAQDAPVGQPGGSGVGCSDDENSQAEGLNPEPAANGGQPPANANASAANNVHYENIYESIEQYAGLGAVGGGGGGASGQQPIHRPVAISGQSPAPLANGMMHSVHVNPYHHPLAYRNELYDRTAGYDVPRGRAAGQPASYYQNQASLQPSLLSGAPPGGPRYANLHLDLNRSRYQAPTQQQQRTPRQRSFDDTESYHYHRYQLNGTGGSMPKQSDNLYERVREEPAYQNTGSLAASNRTGLYGRFDVIGHGVGRIERHLSSSCGNIDHYSLGGHYAVLGHSHLGTVGHIRLNQSNGIGGAVVNGGNAPSQAPSTITPTTTTTQTKDGTTSSSTVNVKSFFSCLGGENSQSMNNLNKPPPTGPLAGVSGAGVAAALGAAPADGSTLSNGQGSSIVGGLASAAAVGSSATGTIPKINRKTKQSQQHVEPPAFGGLVPIQADSPIELAAGGRVTKPSLQWLLVNKWLPMWVGQTPPDYKFIDFNFMFSRNCDGCATASHTTPPPPPPLPPQELVRYGQAMIEQTDYIPPAREYPTMTGSYPRVLRNTPQLARLREHEYENVPLSDGSVASGLRTVVAPLRPMGARATAIRPLAGSVSRLRDNATGCRTGADSFRSWSFNFEDNSFRPARSNGQFVQQQSSINSGTAGSPIVRDVRRITDGTFGARDLQPLDTGPKPGPSGLQRAAITTASTASPDESGDASAAAAASERHDLRRLSLGSTSSSGSENFVMESLAAEVGGLAEDSSISGGDVDGGDGMTVANGTTVGAGSSNESSESFNYEPELVADTADRSMSEDEVEIAVGPCPMAQTNYDDEAQGEK